jgi:hypothetical protein
MQQDRQLAAQRAVDFHHCNAIQTTQTIGEHVFGQPRDFGVRLAV